MQRFGIQEIWIFLAVFCVLQTLADDDIDDEDEEYDIRPRVIGGQRAQPNQFPYAAALKGDFPKTRRSTYCGGTIVGETWLITAAHCFSGKTEVGDTMLNPEYWTVQVGNTVIDLRYGNGAPRALQASSIEVQESTIKSDVGTRTLLKVLGAFLKEVTNFVNSAPNQYQNTRYRGIEVKKVFLHPKFSDDDLEYDLALVQLTGPLPLSGYPLMLKTKLPLMGVDTKSLPSIGDQCYLVGWGCTKTATGPSPYAMYTQFDVLDNKECSELYSHAAGLNDDHEFCAGFHMKNVGICPGDSGSGLICPLGNDWELMGVASATHAKDPANFPGLFTRVAYFMPWIHQTMQQNTDYFMNRFRYSYF